MLLALTFSLGPYPSNDSVNESELKVATINEICNNPDSYIYLIDDGNRCGFITNYVVNRVTFNSY